MRISWVLPPDIGPGIGGYAIVYGYANRLAARGHDVTVVHLTPPSLLRPTRNPKAWVRLLVWWLGRLATKPGADYRPDPRVRRISRVRLSRRSVAGADAVIATSWRTAGPVAAVAGPLRGFYFIQHHEVWDGDRDAVNETWRLPLRRIVIAEWLSDVAADLGALPVAHVPNAIDAELYRPSVAPERRAAASVAMLWHRKGWKRSADGLAALARVQGRVPELDVDVFSVFPRPDDVPPWVRWHESATAEEVARILNRAAIFLSPSEAEGWPLPPAEALACGCALVSTDIGGVRDYAHDGRTALLVPVGNVERMAEAVLRLVEDDGLRLRLAHAGSALIGQEFTWDRAVDRLERVLQSAEHPSASVVA
jgi:L-malate glycosyltransferase